MGRQLQTARPPAGRQLRRTAAAMLLLLPLAASSAAAGRTLLADSPMGLDPACSGIMSDYLGSQWCVAARWPGVGAGGVWPGTQARWCKRTLSSAPPLTPNPPCCWLSRGRQACGTQRLHRQCLRHALQPDDGELQLPLQQQHGRGACSLGACAAHHVGCCLCHHAPA